MTTKTLIATGTAGLATLALATPALAAAPRIVDEPDADLLSGNRLHLSVDVRGATRVSFRIDGRTVNLRHTETDDDGDKEFERIVGAGKTKPGRRTVTIKATGADGTTTKTYRVNVEREDD